ncbi:MAG TPA: hypothetical protein VK890_07910, partial [Bacteroidia bacterium]|nr:hypothetical protein [Bacteroidia bacterium]
MRKLNMLTGFNAYICFIGVFCLLETLCFTYLQHYPELGTLTAVLYFISGLCICVASLIFAVKVPPKIADVQLPENALYRWLKILIAAIFLIFIIVLLVQFGNSTFPDHPISYEYADMLPLLRAACERWIHGVHVYSPVKEVWGGENIPYLPAMWMPFAPSLIMQVDMRWTCLVLTAISIAIILVSLTRLRYHNLYFLAPVFLLGAFMIVKFYTREDISVFVYSEEAIPAFFYTLLFIALMYENDWLIGVALALCTLSRFSLIPFMPFFFLWLLINKQFKRAIKTGLVFGILVLVIFVIPFFVEQPQFFLDIPNNYLKGAENFWDSNDYTLHGKSNLGLAYVFGYDYKGLMSTLSS